MPGPDDSGPASVPSSGASVPQSGARISDEDAPPSSGPVSARDADEGAPPSSGTYTRVHAAIFRFVASRKEKEGRDFVIGVVKERLGSDVPLAMLEDIVQSALAEAVECRWPPWTVGGVPAWLARLTRRQIAAYFRKERGRQEQPRPGQPKKPEPTARPRAASARNAEAARLEAHDDGAAAGPRVEPAERTEWIPDHSLPPTDERARARLVHDWLAKQIGDDPRKVATLELMYRHEVEGHAIGDLALEQRTTPAALYNRFHKLRQELGPKVRRMDDERTRRSVFLALILFGFGVFLALVLWLLGVFTPPPPPVVPPHEAVPSASAVAPPPVFNQALPPPSSSGVQVGPKL
jgi:DNA-directed RNA polymerase specialized sigma24 family protein